MLREVLIEQSPIPVLKLGLQAFAERQRAIASNIANAEVPNFKRREVKFEKQLKEALGGKEYLTNTNPRHLPISPKLSEIQPELLSGNNENSPSGVNNVDIDMEMTQLAANQIQYAATIRTASRFFELFRMIKTKSL